MFSKSFMSWCRFCGLTLTVLFLAGYLCAGAQAQAAPAAVASFAAGVNHATASGSLSSLGSIANIAADSYGDLLVVDDVSGALYEFSSGGGDAVVLVPAGGLAGPAVNKIVSPGIAVDSANNLYIEGGSCILVYSYPWSGLSALGPTSTSAVACGQSSTFYNFGFAIQPWGIALDPRSSSLLVGISPAGSTAGSSIVSIPIAGSSAAPRAGAPSTLISGLRGAPISIAADLSGNTHFVEQGAGALTGAFKIPAQAALTTDSALSRIDPALPQVTGVAADSQGNIYISDNTQGVFVLPQGAPSSSSAFLLTPVPARAGVAFYGASGLFVPTAESQWNRYGDIAQVSFSAAQFGAVAVGAKTPATQPVAFTFNGSAAPARIEVLEAGKTSPDFAVAGNSCLSALAPASYTALSSCSVSVRFAPQAPGNVVATLVLLDAKNNLLASIPLSGIGISAAVRISPAAQSAIGSKLVTPGQLAVDAAGNLYVADSGLGKVELFPLGSGSGAAAVSVGTGLKAPTGVAVDGAGDLFIADSGSVYEVPESYAGGGLNARGQVTLKTGLGSHIQLAADGLGDLYISDADNNKVYELQNFSSGWNTNLPGVLSSQVVTLPGAAFDAPSAIAVDPYNNLFVVNGGSVYEITAAGTQSEVLSGIAGISSLAVDASGSVFATLPGGTVRIPYLGGALNFAAKTAVASGAASPAAVALDSLGNIYVADGATHQLNFSSASASVGFGNPKSGQPQPGSSATQIATLLNYGNAALAVTGYVDTPDYSEISDTCSGNSIAVNAFCTATIKFNAAVGHGGALAGTVLVQGNIANSPVGVNATGEAAALAATTTSIAASPNGTIENIPTSVTVAPSSGTGTPTGSVTLIITPGNNVPQTNPPPATYTFTQNLNASGVAQFASIVGFPIGSYSFAATYSGDSNYQQSSASANVSVTKSVPTVLTEPPISASAVNTPPASPAQLEPYTLPCTSGTPSNCTTDYSLGQPAGTNPQGYLVIGGLCDGCVGSWGFDGSDDQWIYNYSVNVASQSGVPMFGTAAFGGGTSRIGWNYGSVNFAVSSSQSTCGNEANSVSIVNVSSVNNATSAAFSLSCAPIDSTNTTVPVFMAYYSFTPNYSGEYSDLTENNPNYGSSSGSTPIGIWAVAHPVVQISSSPATLTVAAGSSATAQLTLTSVLGYGYVDRTGTGAGNPNYSMPLALQCQGLPAYASCSFSYPTPNSADAQATAYPQLNFPAFGGLLCQNSTTQYCAVDVGPPLGSVNSHASATTVCDATTDGCLGPGTVQMTITTNVSPGTVSSLKTYMGGVAFAGIFGLGLLGLAFRRKASRFGWLVIVACLLLGGGALTGITACSTTNLGTGVTTGVTPAQSYWVTITANQVGTEVVKTSSGPVLVYGNGNQMSLPYTIYVTVTH